MLTKALLICLVVAALVSARAPLPATKKERVRERREKMDLVVTGSRNITHQAITQGSCLEGWVDASSVGLGCILGDLQDNVDEPTSETVCKNFGENGRLVEIFNYDQMHFLRNALAIIESESERYVWWWIGLTDSTEEGTFVWPSGLAGNYTWWDEDYGEPTPDYEEYEYDCVQMQSAVDWALKWMTYECGDTQETYPVCQLL